MTITEHGSLDTQKLLRAVSEILSDKYGAEITASVKTADTSADAGSVAGSANHSNPE